MLMKVSGLIGKNEKKENDSVQVLRENCLVVHAAGLSRGLITWGFHMLKT